MPGTCSLNKQKRCVPCLQLNKATSTPLERHLFDHGQVKGRPPSIDQISFLSAVICHLPATGAGGLGVSHAPQKSFAARKKASSVSVRESETIERRESTEACLCDWRGDAQTPLTSSATSAIA